MSVLRIRSITAGSSLNELFPGGWEALETLYNHAERLFAAEGVSVQTRRLVLEPLCPEMNIEYARVRAALDAIAARINRHGIRWVCLPVSGREGSPQDDVRRHTAELILAYPFLFLNLMIAEKGIIASPFLLQAAKDILNVSRLSRNGFDNFRLGCGANIRANTPFFPFSRHDGQPGFSFAVENIHLIMNELRQARAEGLTLLETRERIISKLTKHCRQIDSIGRCVEEHLEGKFVYHGLDMSIAPFPDDRSVADMMRLVGLDSFGGMGAVAATSYFTNILKTSLAASGIRHTGFNGVMFSPLEDRGLAGALKADSDFTIQHLMLYSTVCGCGVDMVPIEGNTFPESLASLLLDVGTLS